MDIDRLAKPFLKAIVPYKPGKPIEQVQRERGLDIPFAKLASNENPYPPHEKIRQAVLTAMDGANRYPESGSPELVDRLAATHRVDPSEIFVANGTNEIIDLLVRAYVDAEENAVYSELSFVIYKLVCLQCNVGSIEVPIRDYTHDLSAMAAAINDKTKLVFVCNPNNPTATYNSSKEVLGFIEKVPDHALIVLDEAYCHFVNRSDYPDGLELRKKKKTLVLLRTFSKFYSLAGMRIGYAIADPHVVESLHKMRQPFNVNRVAQAAAMAALDCAGELQWIIDETIRERDRVRDEILTLDCVCPPSQTNFLFVIPRGYTGDICRKIEELGVIVRGMSPFGGPENSFRVNMGTPEENTRFLDALKRVLPEGRR